MVVRRINIPKTVKPHKLINETSKPILALEVFLPRRAFFHQIKEFKTKGIKVAGTAKIIPIKTKKSVGFEPQLVKIVYAAIRIMSMVATKANINMAENK